MSKKNFKVATTQEGKTPKQDTKHVFATKNVKKDKTPTGKTKTLKDKEKIRKEREEQYKNFRVNALIRKAKRRGFSEEQIKVKVDELVKQISSPNDYNILIMFNRENNDMVKQALKKEDIVCKILADTYGWIEGDQELLATLREILPALAKIHPYVKRKQPVLPAQEPSGRSKKTKTKAQKKAAAFTAKVARKKKNLRMHKKKVQSKMSLKTLRAAKKHNPSIVVHMKPKKSSTAQEKASTMKKAA